MIQRKKKHRLALFGMDIFGGGVSGSGIPSLIDLFQHLSSTYDIVFYCFQPTDKKKLPLNISVRHVTKLPIPGRLKYVLLMIRFVIDQISNPTSIIFAVSAYPTGWWAVKMGKIVKRKVVVQYIALEAVALPEIGEGNLIRSWLAKITRQVSQEADKLVVVADYQKKIAMQSLSVNRSIDMLPLRVNYNNFFYKSREISFPVKFIHIAYYSAIKDQDTMFKAFSVIARNIDCQLTVIGDGFKTKAVQTMMQELAIADKVTFAGRQSQAEVAKYLDNAHILLHTARFETGCAVIQEAMASGVAVAGTRVGILADIGDEYAVIVPPQDSDLLADKVLRLIDNPVDYSRMTQAAYHWISTFDAAWAHYHYNRFLDTLVNDAED